MKLEPKDKELIASKGISEEKLQEELMMLRDGFPYLVVESAATVENGGIKKVSDNVKEVSKDLWNKYLATSPTVVKMVPASGAASRMFKDVFAFANGDKKTPDNDFMKKFFNEIEKFAFFHRLNFTALQNTGKSIDSLIKEKRYKEVADTLLRKTGLNYGQLPKALLQFHKVTGTSRTPLEEHLAEGAQYATGKDGVAHVHFTVSPEHIPFVEMKIEEAKGILEHKYGVKFDITFSIQKPSTDTVAATLEGEPYRENGELFFRPGGHGALIENLNDLDADVVFVKNIDNVVPDNLRDSTVEYKKVLGGILVGVKSKIDNYCKEIESGKYTEESLKEMLDFMRTTLCITHDPVESLDLKQKAEWIFSKLHRPVRVCGMVKNEGEPGGGPFLAYNPDGTVSPQILESTQLNPADKKAKEIMKSATHFNPVDLVCAIKDYKGEKFNLVNYVDKATGFISQKSREGVEIKALELPGLWNGAMSDWNTVMVEVPVSTFNPVKTVNDLLRPAHQG